MITLPFSRWFANIILLRLEELTVHQLFSYVPNIMTLIGIPTRALTSVWRLT